MDISDLKEILRILEAQDITEFELEQDGVKLRVCRSSAARRPGAGVRPWPPVRAGARPAPAALRRRRRRPRPAAAGGGARRERHPREEPDRGHVLPGRRPEQPAFVSVGDRVKVGQVLCIIEAMKLMNEIEAEVAGEVVKIHPENGQPVQYGDPLFTVRPA